MPRRVFSRRCDRWQWKCLAAYRAEMLAMLTAWGKATSPYPILKFNAFWLATTLITALLAELSMSIVWN